MFNIKTCMVILGILIAISGCAQENNSKLVVYVHDTAGNVVPDATVNAYKNYVFPENSARWASIEGTIESSTETDNYGFAYFELEPGNYAFKAISKDGSYGGIVSAINGNGKRIDVTVASLPDSQSYASFRLVNPDNSEFSIGVKRIMLSWAQCTSEGQCSLNVPVAVNSENMEFPLKAGNWVFEFSSDGYTTKTVSFDISEGQAKSFDVSMEKQ